MTGKVANITATSPYILLIIMLINGLQLEGSWEGISYLWKTDFTKILSPAVWLDAANQVIFQMSVAVGTLISYGSFQP
jgi:SNF family Na+-dependent transporter